MIRIQQEMTTRCTCNCLFCPRHVIGTNRTLGDISLKMSELVIQRYEELDEPFTLSVSGFGEPLLYPGLMSWLQDVRHRCPEARIELNTNATLLDRKRAEWLIELVDEIQISLNIPFEFDEDGHELFKMVKGCDYATVRRNIENFYEIKGEGKPETDIRILKTKYTVHRMKEILNDWGQMLPRGDAIRIAEFENWTGLIDERKWGVTYPDKREQMIYICKDVDGTHITITKEGDTYACCHAIVFPEKHPFTLGNIKRKSIKQLLNSDWRKILFQMHKARKYLDACSTCSVLRVSPPDAGLRYLNPEGFYR